MMIKFLSKPKTPDEELADEYKKKFAELQELSVEMHKRGLKIYHRHPREYTTYSLHKYKVEISKTSTERF